MSSNNPVDDIEVIVLELTADAERGCDSCNQLLSYASRGLPSSDRCVKHQLIRLRAAATVEALRDSSGGVGPVTRAPISDLKQTGGCCLAMYRGAGGITDGRPCPYHD